MAFYFLLVFSCYFLLMFSCHFLLTFTVLVPPTLFPPNRLMRMSSWSQFPELPLPSKASSLLLFIVVIYTCLLILSLLSHVHRCPQDTQRSYRNKGFVQIWWSVSVPLEQVRQYHGGRGQRSGGVHSTSCTISAYHLYVVVH